MPGGSGGRATHPAASGRAGRLRGTRDASGGLGPRQEALGDTRRVLRPQAAPGSRGPQAHVSSGLRPRPEALGHVRRVLWPQATTGGSGRSSRPHATPEHDGQCTRARTVWRCGAMRCRAVRRCGGAGGVGMGVRTRGSVRLRWLGVAVRGCAQLQRLEEVVRSSGAAVCGCGGRRSCKMVVLRTVDGGIDGR